jgi:tetratricopeptide (TPR) repeat protein
MDPNNPVVHLCSEGMLAEGEGRFEDARSLFEQAWASRTDDYDACIAAHFMARHQPNDADALAWNEEALRCASAVDERRVRAFYPSLLLNLGFSHESLGHRDEARTCYRLAEDRLGDLPTGPYGDLVRVGIARAIERVR